MPRSTVAFALHAGLDNIIPTLGFLSPSKHSIVGSSPFDRLPANSRMWYQKTNSEELKILTYYPHIALNVRGTA